MPQPSFFLISVVVVISALCVQAKYLQNKLNDEKVALRKGLWLRDVDPEVSQNAQGQSVATYRNRVYTLVLDADKSWSDSERECEATDEEASTLATAETQEELDFLRDFIRVATVGRRVQRYWLGGRKMPKDTQYQWISNGESVPSYFWQAGLPNYGGKAARCSELFYDRNENSVTGRDQLCSTKMPAYICKSAEVTTSPPETTTMTVDTTTASEPETSSVIPETTTAPPETTTAPPEDTTTILPETTTTATSEWTTTQEWSTSPDPTTTTTMEPVTFSSENPYPVTTENPAFSTTSQGWPFQTGNYSYLPLLPSWLHIHLELIQEN